MMMLVALLAASAPQAAPVAAIWKIEGPPGQIRSVTGFVKTGGRIVADQFIKDRAAAREEAAGLGEDRSPAGSCARAGYARPFTRLRRFAASGRLLWTWDVSREGMAVRLMGGSSGDCLSPDGGRLLLVTYTTEAGPPLKEVNGRVLAVDKRPRLVEANGQKTGLPFGTLRQMSDAYWRRGGDATLYFTNYDVSTGKETPDIVVLGRRP